MRRISHRATAPARLEKKIELVVLSVKRSALVCRPAGGGERTIFRAKRATGLVPGEIITVRPARRWTYAGMPTLSGQIEGRRIHAEALGLTPLALHKRGVWNPKKQFWGDPGQPVEPWAKPLIAGGPRPQYEMEQVLPGYDADDPASDPIGASEDRLEAGDFAGTERLLQEACEADLRCLDAHAHLGNLYFHDPGQAIRHYEVGTRIGELSLGSGFNGVLLWGMIDNRPFLRCLNGYGLCLWRLGRFRQADLEMQRMLRLNPADNLGIRFLIDDVRARCPWEKRRDQ